MTKRIQTCNSARGVRTVNTHLCVINRAHSPSFQEQDFSSLRSRFKYLKQFHPRKLKETNSIFPPMCSHRIREMTTWTLDRNSLKKPLVVFCMYVFLQFTFQKDADQRSAVTVLGLLNKQLPVIQHPRYWIAPLNNSIHDVARVVFLVGSKCLH